MAGGGGDAEANQCGRVAWVSTRRAAPAADTIAGQLLGRYLLADVLASKDAPLSEFASDEYVMMELPPVTKLRYQHLVLESLLHHWRQLQHHAVGCSQLCQWCVLAGKDVCKNIPPQKLA